MATKPPVDRYYASLGATPPEKGKTASSTSKKSGPVDRYYASLQAAAQPKKHGHHGALGFVQNLGSDAVGAVEGIPAGALTVGGAFWHDAVHDPNAPWGHNSLILHPLRGKGKEPKSHLGAIAKNIGKSYEQTYGPLAHGDVNAFLHTFYEHPLGPVLDAATVVTGGAAGIAKAGKLAAAAGAIDRESRLATLGDVARTSKLKGARQLASEGKLPLDHPLVEELNQGTGPLFKPHTGGIPKRLAAKALQDVLNQLPAHAPMVGQVARYNRELDRLVRHEPLKFSQQVNDYRHAYSHLGKWDSVAFHFRATAVDPRAYAVHLEKLYVGRNLPARVGKQITMLRDPKLIAAYEHPTPQVLAALDEGRKVAKLLEQSHLDQAGAHASDLAASFAERPYLHRRILSGAHLQPVKELVPGVNGATEERVIGHAYVGGKSLNAIRGDIANEAKQMAEQGKHPLAEPFYLPDLAPARRLRDAFQKMGGGKGIPKTEDALKMNAGVLFNTARLALHPHVLDQAFTAHTRFVLHSAVHDALVREAVRVPVDESLPHGWTYIRRSDSETIPHTTKVEGDVSRRLNEFVSAQDNELYRRFVTPDAKDAEGAGAYRLAVHTRTVRQLAGEFKRSENTLRWVWEKPTAMWRAIVLGLRPGFFTNNAVGNNILWAVRFAGPAGFEAYARAIADIRGPRFVNRMLHSTPGRPELQKLYEQYAPELAQGTFGRTQFEGTFQKLSQGVGPFTAKVAEDLPRKAGFVAAITPAVRAAMKEDGVRFVDRLKTDNATFAVYAKRALDKDPRLARHAVDKVNDALGNYLNLSEFEKRTIRGLIPFYGWLRAITQITYKTALDTPGRALVLERVGQIGEQALQDKLGPLPDWLLNILPVGAQHDGKQGVLTTKGLNPYASITDVAQGVGGLAGGPPGSTGKAASQLGLNPFLAAIVQNLSGKDLYTGKDVTGGWPGLPLQTVQAVGGQLPPATLIKAALGHGNESKLYGKQTGLEALLAFLGAPYRHLDVAQAQRYGEPR